MLKLIQGTISPGFGGLELVIIEFHEWLIQNNIDAYVLAVEDSPLEKNLLKKGFRQTTITVPKDNIKEMIQWYKKFDSKNTVFLFHRHQGLKQFRFHKPISRLCAMSHTFYDVKKTDFFHKMVFSKVDQWIALTDKHKENLVQTTGIDSAKVMIIPNGVDLNKFKATFKDLPNKNNKIHIGILARLDRQKGQEIAIQAISDLKNNGYDNFILHLYGEDTPSEKPVRPDLELLANRLNVKDQIVFEGFQEHLEQKMQNLDIVWMPSYKETFGRCIIEAMASGVPVVASNAGGVSDIIRHKENGYLFETKNANDLCQQTIQLISNPLMFKSIQIQARKDAEKYYNVQDIWKRLFLAVAPEAKLSETKLDIAK